MWKYDLALVAGVVVLYNEVIFGSARVIGRDVLHYLVPIGAALRAGFVGDGSLLWDSGVDHGLPVIARWSPMVFYPGQWLHAVSTPLTAISVGILLHLSLAALATLRLALRYVSDPRAAWVGAFSFAYGGYLLSVSVGGGYLFGAALLPLSLLCFHRLAERPSLARMGQTAVVLALQIFCADPQTPLYEGAFLVPLIVLLHHRADSRLSLRLGMAVLATVFALGLSACQWWPSLEFSALSIRAHGVALDDRQAWAFHPLRIAQLLSPHVLGAVTPENTFWARSLVNAKLTIPWAPYVYSGLAPWVGLVAVNWRQRRLALLGALALFFLALAMGPWTPLHQLVTAVLPGARLFRYPEKLLLFVTLATCLLGAAGLGRLLEHLTASPGWPRRLRLRVAGVFAALAAAVTALRVWLDPAAPARLDWFAGVVARQHSDVRPDLALEMTASSLVHTAAIASLIVGICILAPRLRPGVLLSVGACLVAADLLSASLTQRYLSSEPSSFSGTPALCAALRPDASGVLPLVWRRTAPLPAPGAAMAEDKAAAVRKTLEYGEPLNAAWDDTRFERQRRWDWQTLRPNIGVTHCARYADGYEAGRLLSHTLLTASMPADLDRLLRILGIRYIIAAPGALDPGRFPMLLQSRELRAAVHQVSDPLPYAHLTGRAERVASVEGAIARLADASFDVKQALVLEREREPEAYPEAPRRAQVRLHREGEVVIEVDVGAPGYLMLEETYYPGWRAEVDSVATVVERANATFIGIELPAGTHRVRFVFDPPIQQRGNAASLASFAALAALIGVGRVLRRRPSS